MPRIVKLERFGGRAIIRYINIIIKAEDSNKNIKELSSIYIYQKEVKNASKYKEINKKSSVIGAIKYKSDERKNHIIAEHNNLVWNRQSLHHVKQHIHKNTLKLVSPKSFINFENTYDSDQSDKSCHTRLEKEKWINIVKKMYNNGKILIKTGNKRMKRINISNIDTGKAQEMCYACLKIGIKYYTITLITPLIVDVPENTFNIQQLILAIMKVAESINRKISTTKRGPINKNKNTKNDFYTHKNECETKMGLLWRIVRGKLGSVGSLDVVSFNERIWKKLEVPSFTAKMSNNQEFYWKRHFNKILNIEKLNKNFINNVRKQGSTVVIGWKTKLKNAASGINGWNTTKTNKINKQDKEE